MSLFPCGHPRLPGNTTKPASGSSRGRCRTCQIIYRRGLRTKAAMLRALEGPQAAQIDDSRYVQACNQLGGFTPGHGPSMPERRGRA